MSRTSVPVWVVVAILFAGSFCLRAEPDVSWVAPEHTTKIKNPFGAESSEAVTKGKALYKDRCSDCHGSKGRGDGSAATDLPRRPRDFSTAEVSQQTDGELFWKITEGRRPMPSYRNKLSDEQRWQVVKYLRTLAAKPGGKKQKTIP